MATLQFKDKREINAGNYKELAPVYLKQMAIGATLGFGEEFNTPEHFLEQCGDGDINDGMVELWDIVDESEPEKVLYDCWYYLADTANVFYAGTDKDTGIAMCQDSFDNHIGGAEADALAEALQKAYYQKED